MSQETRRTFILGFDGIPWYLVERWAEQGELPNLRTLLQDGTGGPLESTTPASTPLAWPSIATGTWPDKHGIYGFQKLTSSYSHRMTTNSDLERPAIWDAVTPAVVGNVPMTYPVEDIDGTMVGGLMSPEMDDRYAHPTDLVEEIETRIPEYQISLLWDDYVGAEDDLVQDIESLVEARRELLALLMAERDWRLFFFVFTAPDRLQHLVWDEDVLLDHYQHLDEIVGEVMDYLDETGGTLFVVSDHGFGPTSKTVAANSVLESAGYLARKERGGVRNLLGRLGIDKSRLSGLLDAVSVDEGKLVQEYLPRSVVDSVAERVPGDHLLYDLDPSRSKAFVHGFGNLYVNDEVRFDDGIVPTGEIQPLKQDLASLFGGLTDPDTDEPVLTVRDGDELFPTDPRSPDLVLEPHDEYEITTSLDDAVFGEPTADAGHRKDGIFLAWGPDVREGGRVSEATVVDVAPTALHSVGEPVPQAADGDVLDVFAPRSPAARRSVSTRRYAKTGEDATVERDGEDEAEMEEVKERLQGLGYMEQ
jgi:predicted AlkP superfamily phosphohydrolase/phosphomutase